VFLKSKLEGSEWSALSYGRFIPYTQRVESTVGYSARRDGLVKRFLPCWIQNLDSALVHQVANTPTVLRIALLSRICSALVIYLLTYLLHGAESFLRS